MPTFNPTPRPYDGMPQVQARGLFFNKTNNNKMRTETIYKFAELSEEAKQQAIENYRKNHTEFFWVEEWMESVKSGLKAFGAELDKWSIDPVNINASHWRIKNNNENTDEISGLRLRTWLLNNHYSNFYERKHYGQFLPADKRSGKQCYQYYSKIQKVKACCPFTGYCGDDDFMGVFRAFIKNPDSRTLFDLLEDATEKTLRGLEADCEHQLSDEYISEHMTTNNYEFTEDGEIF